MKAATTTTTTTTAARPRSPSHAAKNKTPEDRVWEFGEVLSEREGRLRCRPCDLPLDHTRRSTIVEHLRSRKHHRLLEEFGLDSPPTPSSPTPPLLTPHVIYVDGGVNEAGTEQGDASPSYPRTSSPQHPRGPQGLTGPYLLKKETHCTTVLDQLMRDDTYSDVTLTAEGQSLRAHRVVLCLSSGYFRQVLSRDLNVQSVVVLRDVKFAELRNVLNFIYTGEATVDASELESFMRTAELLEISSLCEGHHCLLGRGLYTLPSMTSIGNFDPPQERSSVGKKSCESLDSSAKSLHDSSGYNDRLVSGHKRVLETNRNSPPFKSQKINDGLSGDTISAKSYIDEMSADFVNHINNIKKEVDDSSLEVRNETTLSRGMGFNDQFDIATTSKKDSEINKTEEGKVTNQDLDKNSAIPGYSTNIVLRSRQSPCTANLIHDSEINSPLSRDSPGVCPYCLSQPRRIIKGLPMMKHLLVSHPCKPAYPCDMCWRVFITKPTYKKHHRTCSSRRKPMVVIEASELNGEYRKTN